MVTSILVPIYNEVSSLSTLLERLKIVCQNLQLEYEIICVDDGSFDGTLDLLIQHYQQNPRIKIVALSRNFGKDIALTAGLDYATGDAVVPIDADLQDPPETIAELVAKWQEGYDAVYAVRRTRQGESWLKRLTASGFYRIIGHIGKVPIPPNTGDFRLLDRRVVEAMKQMPERTRFMKGLFAWVGFRQTAILYDREPRHAGRTTWNYWKLWNFAIDGITAFSQMPLKVWSYLGLTFALVAFAYATVLIVRTLVLGIDVPGYASIMVAVLFMGGVQLLGLGILGEYLGRVYEEVKGRPLYLVRECYGLDLLPPRDCAKE